MKYRYVQKWVDRQGRVHVYFRRSGFAPISLSGPAGSPEFLADYYAALNATERGQLPHVRTLAKTLARERSRQKQSGVYLLLLEGELVYVGSSADMAERVNTHRTNGRPFDKVFYISASGDERALLEKALIKAFRPSGNRQIPRSVKVSNSCNDPH